MPGFDGNGPMKRGRLIGRGRGPCGKNANCREPEEKPVSAAGPEPAAPGNK